MAFVRTRETPAYTCLAADTKPTTNIKIGAIAYEIDTSFEYVFDGTNWKKVLPADLYRQKSRATGVDAIDFTVDPGQSWMLYEVRLHLGGAGGDELFTVTLDSGAGVEYDALLYSVSVNGSTDVYWQPSTPLHFDEADEVIFALTNGDGVTYGLEVVYASL